MWFEYLLIGLFALRALARVAQIGAPRDPVEPPEAVFTVLVNALLIWGVITYWR